jgi:hypothetical protein
MNYQIVKDEKLLREFIEWLPELGENEKFFCCLFARKKYGQGEIQTSDKAQLKRFLSDKKRLFEKIKQLECEVGSYQLKDGPAPEESIVLYINPNPRDLKRAAYESIIALTNLLKNDNNGFNPHQEVLSTIQKTSGKKRFLDFDIDDKEFDLQQLATCVNTSALHILQTRGGYHVLVELDKVEAAYKKSFYNKIAKLDVDQIGDQLLPVAGCTQGGFMPRFIDVDWK